MGSRRSYLQTLSVVALFCLVCKYILQKYAVDLKKNPHDFFFPPSYDSTGTVDGRMPEVRGKVNGEAELTCSVGPSYSAVVSSGSLHVVEWVRQGLDVPVLMKFGSYAPRVHPQYEGRVSLLDISTLRLESLKLEDQGLYECRILLLDKPREELQNGTWIMLSVIAAPSFTKTPPPLLESVVGGHLSLPCVAVGNPVPTITWLKDGSVIQIGNDQEEGLSLTAVNVHSAGQYTCHASNSEGNTTLQTKVKIKGPPVIVVPPKSSSLNASQDALLHCQAVADPSNMTYVWLKGGDNVYHLESLKSRVKIMVDGTLLISRLIPEDSGNYTCAPTNGLLTPPTASAVLTVMHPAQALGMPRETYLPTGMTGMVNCSLIAQPPLLRVDWTKDGEPLDLSLYPGWSVTQEGNLLMATVNDDATGVYTCTPFNNYGSTGRSGPTQVILQDPPSFISAPEKQYKQKVGRTLLIPCQGNDDATVQVRWTKVGLTRPLAYSVTPNGSLWLRSLTKDHHGIWECSVSNRVALVKAFTQIFVLGTSPHVATSLSVSPGVKRANISWEAGFDGGSAQTFSVWVKKISARANEGKHEWFSVPVPAISGTALVVTGLSPATEYQFSVLSHNKVGTGPFSEISTVRTLDPTARRGQLPKPPSSLSASLGSAGVVLHWAAPLEQPAPITGFVLQSRVKQEDWINLDEDISANRSEIIVEGLHKDCVYELRLLTRRGELLSEPGPSLNVSTMGMEMYTSSSRRLESPEPLLAGVLGGVGFMCLALVLLLGFAYLIKHRKNLRRQKTPKEPPSAIYKCSPSIKISGSGSTDSVLKKSLLPANASSSTISSSSKTDCSSFTRENGQQLLSNRRRSLNQFQGLKSCPVFPSVELITRSPDGLFVMTPYDTLNVQKLASEEQDSKNPPFVLSVDLLPRKQSESNASRQTCDITRHLDEDVFDHSGNYDGFADLNSLCSNSSRSSICLHKKVISPTFPVLPHLRSSHYQPSTTASTLVLQMEHERERGNLTRCLKLAKEREELARELQKYKVYKEEIIRGTPVPEKRENGGNKLFHGYKRHTLPCTHRQSYEDSFALSPSPYFSSSVHWNNFSPMNTDRTYFSPSTPPNLYAGKQHPTPSLTGERADRSFNNRLTPPHASPTMRHKRVQETPQGDHDVPQSISSETNTPSSETPRQTNPPFHQKYSQRSNLILDAGPDAEDDFPESIKQNVGIEMSVDEPALETRVTKMPMLHHRIASHVREGFSRPSGYEEMRRSVSFYYQDKSSGPQLRRAVSQGSKLCDSKQKRLSLDSRRHEDMDFLTPDAWIDSLSKEKHTESSDSLHADNQSLPGNNISKYSPNVPITSQTTDYLPISNPLRSLSDPKTTPASVLPNPPKWPEQYQDIIQNTTSYPRSTIEFSRNFVLHNNKPQNNLAALEMEAESYEEVPDCGGSYSSFASSGRGSMEPANRRLSFCHFSTNNTSSPETVQEVGQANTPNTYSHQIAKNQRKPSVDENYEWDEADTCSQSGDHHGLVTPLKRRNAAALCSPRSVKFPTKPQTNFSQSSSLKGHQSSRCALREPDTVLF
nr:protein turtle homolog A-like isoform X2 [Syngnathus scovelli]